MHATDVTSWWLCRWAPVPSAAAAASAARTCCVNIYDKGLAAPPCRHRTLTACVLQRPSAIHNASWLNLPPAASGHLPRQRSACPPGHLPAPVCCPSASPRLQAKRTTAGAASDRMATAGWYSGPSSWGMMLPSPGCWEQGGGNQHEPSRGGGARQASGQAGTLSWWAGRMMGRWAGRWSAVGHARACIRLAGHSGTWQGTATSGGKAARAHAGSAFCRRCGATTSRHLWVAPRVPQATAAPAPGTR